MKEFICPVVTCKTCELRRIREKQRANARSYRERMKNDPEFKEKERLRQIAYQEKVKSDPRLLEKERERKRLWAKKKKQTN